MHFLARGLLLICLSASCAGLSQAGEPLACEMPDELTTPTDPLAHSAAALAKGNVNILALGSGSTVGDPGTSAGPALAYSTPGRSFPYRMIEALQAMRPKAHFELTVKGGRSLTAEAMLPMLREQLAAHHYDLVLWQTGTVEAVHGSRTDLLRGTLQDGADAAQAAGADLVLIDPQFSRFLRANADLSPYETVMQQITGNPDVSLFRRFDLTQNWVNNGQVDLERVDRDRRDNTVDLLNSCLGQALARYVIAGVTAH